MLMCLFEVGKIIWGLKFRGPKCAICGLRFAVGQIIWGLIFLVSQLSKTDDDVTISPEKVA